MRKIHVILAVIVMLMIVSLFYYNNDKKSIESTKPPEKENSLSYIVSFSIGKSTVDGRLIKSGDVLKRNPKIVVPNLSQLDIQVNGLQSKVKLRIKSGTEIQFFTRRKDDNLDFVSFITKGKAIYSVTRLNKYESILVFTPYTKNKVRGTQFTVAMRDDFSFSSSSVGVGQMATSFSTTTLDDLSSNKDIDSKFEPKIIEEGKEIKISKKEVDQIETASSEGLAKKLDDALESVDISTKEINIIITEANEILEINLTGTETEEQIKSVVADNIKQNKDNRVMLTMEKLYQKPSGFLKLTNGTVIRGIIYSQDKETIVVITPDGEKRFSKDEVPFIKP